MSAFAHPHRPTASGDFAAFACEIAPRRDAVHVIPVGELDLATAPIVAERLEEVRDAGFDRVVLDLRRLRFLDSSGLALILHWSKAAHGTGAFQVIPGPAPVQRVFDITNANESIEFVDGVPGTAGAMADGALVQYLDRRIAEGGHLSERFIGLWGRALSEHRRDAQP